MVQLWSNAAVLYLVRHGRTAANAAGLLLGRLDPELDEVGRWQAARLGAALGPLDRVDQQPADPYTPDRRAPGR